MASLFHHHPDGLIRIESGEDAYTETVGQFQKDLLSLGQDVYEDLPETIRERRYDNGRHTLYSKDSQFTGEEPWLAGDLFIALLPELMALKEEPVVERDPSATRNDVWLQIKRMRDVKKESGVQVNGHWFHSDDSSRVQQIGLVLMGAALPAGVMWKTMDGTFVEMTQSLADSIFQAVAASDMVIFAVAERHRVAIQSLETNEDLLAYDYSTGWPSCYGDA